MGSNEKTASWHGYGFLPLGEKSPIAGVGDGGVGRVRERGIKEWVMGEEALGTGAINWNHKSHHDREHGTRTSYNI